MLDETVNEKKPDIKFDVTSIFVKDVIENTDMLDEYITETYIIDSSFDLVKCEIQEIDDAQKGDDPLIVEEVTHHDDDPDIDNVLLVEDYRCPLCLQSFAGQSELDMHVALYNPGEIHYCGYCMQSFHTKRLWSDHVETHVNSKEFICALCLRCYSSRGQLQSHLDLHHPEVRNAIARKSAAAVPAASTKTSSSQRRRQPDDRRPTLTCASCNAVFRRKRTLVRHLLNHTHLCATCGRDFLTKERLKYHLRAHEERPSNACERCAKAFSSKSALARHHLRLHANRDDGGGGDGGRSSSLSSSSSSSSPHLCRICDKYYASKSSLLTHSRIHTGQKRFACPTCGKRFMRKDRLESHALQHGDGDHRRYACTYCGKCISRPENLKYHLRLHTGEKPFACDVCRKTFPSGTALKKHALTHTDRILFKCPVCERTIARKDNFLAHLRIHTGDRQKRRSMVGDVGGDGDPHFDQSVP